MILTLIHVLLSAGLILIVLLQGKGGWLTQKWSGEKYRSKRGVEKIVFFLTILLAILFLVSSIITLIKA